LQKIPITLCIITVLHAPTQRGGKLADARIHLKEAFARKGNMLPGENLPDPTKDDSFLAYRNNKDFWNFLEGLH
jgi:hypothetical protein